MAAIAAGVRSLNRAPASGAATTSGVPHTSEAATRVPQAIASSSTFAHPSRLEARISRSAGAVDVAQLVMRDAPEKAHAVGHAQRGGERLEALLLGPLARDQQVVAGQLCERTDDEVVTFARIRCPTDSRVGPRQAELRAGLLAVDRTENLQVDAIAQHADLVGLRAERHQPVLAAPRTR